MTALSLAMQSTVAFFLTNSVYAHLRAYLHTYIHRCIHTHTSQLACVQTCLNACMACLPAYLPIHVHTCMYTHTEICIHRYIETQIHTNMCMHTSLCWLLLYVYFVLCFRVIGSWFSSSWKIVSHHASITYAHTHTHTHLGLHAMSNLEPFGFLSCRIIL